MFRAKFRETYRFSDINKQNLRQGDLHVVVTVVNSASYPTTFSSSGETAVDRVYR